jgi:hypothetical protein
MIRNHEPIKTFIVTLVLDLGGREGERLTLPRDHIDGTSVLLSALNSNLPNCFVDHNNGPRVISI